MSDASKLMLAEIKSKAVRGEYFHRLSRAMQDEIRLLVGGLLEDWFRQKELDDANNSKGNNRKTKA